MEMILDIIQYRIYSVQLMFDNNISYRWLQKSLHDLQT